MRRAALLVLGAGVLVAAAALHAYRGRDYRPVFGRAAGELVAVRDETQVGRTDSGDIVTDHTLVSDGGFTARVRVRVPPGLLAGDRRPAAILVGGLRTDLAAAEVPSRTDGLIVASVAYPYEGPRRSLSWTQSIRHLPAMRRAALDTPAALLLAAQYLYSRPDVDPDRVSMIGVSFGVPFATAAAATDPRIAGLALLHGGGDVRRLARSAWTGDLPGPAADLLARGVAWTFAPLEPVRYAGEVAPRPFLMVNATSDAEIPRESVLSLYRAARRPKRLVWLDTDHVGASEREIVDRLMDLTLEWMATQDLR